MTEVLASEFSFLNHFFDLIDLLKVLYLFKLLFSFLVELGLATLSAAERQPGFVEAAVSRASEDSPNETGGAADNMDD